MRRTLILLCLAIAPAFGLWEKGLKVKYDINPFSRGSTSFMPMPQTYAEATNAGWVQMDRPYILTGYEELELWCPHKERTLCIYYDTNGNIAGMQVALQVDRLSDNVFDMTDAGYKIWNVTEGGVTTSYYTHSHYYVTAEELAVPAATRFAKRNNDVIVQKNLVLTGYKGKLHVVPTTVSEFTKNNFTEQGCFIGMGQHYYYNMSPTMECTDEQVLPYFLLAYNDQLIGLAFLIPAKYTLPEGNVNYFENPSKLVVKAIVPNGSECYYEYGSTPGLLTMHIYLIKDGHKINCMW